MSKRVVRNHDLRREIAEYVLNCSDDELFNVIYTLEKGKTIPKFLAVKNVRIFLGIALRVVVLRYVKAEYTSMRK